jgi:hypothetical protein
MVDKRIREVKEEPGAMTRARDLDGFAGTPYSAREDAGQAGGCFAPQPTIMF